LNNVYRVSNISKGEERFIHAVFNDNPGFVYKKENTGNIDYGDFKNRDLIVLQSAGEVQSGFVSELVKFVRNGGTLLVFPDKDLPFGGLGNLSSATGFSISEKPDEFEMKVSTIDLEHPIFRHIFEKKPQKPDLPVLSRSFRISAPAGIHVMRSANSQVFLEDIQLGKGHIILSAVALDASFSNFQSHALFVPMALRTAMLSDYKNPLYYGCSETVDIYTGLPFESENGISLNGTGTSIIPEVINRDGDLYLNTNGEIKNPGHYTLKQKNSDSSYADLAFNSSRTESDTRIPDDETFNAFCDENNIRVYEGAADKLASELNKVQKGTPLWKFCILISLLSLLIEILLIRFFRNYNARLSA
jgi:hypothetical protein